MGAWGTGNFDNDDALDWLGDLSDAPGEDALRHAFAAAIEPADDYLESPESSQALAAAEIVAALKGAPAADFPAAAREIVEKLDFPAASALVAEAVGAAERVRTDSELRELWEESDDFAVWDAVVRNLIDRLKA